MTGLNLRALPGPATELQVRVVPGASKDAIVGVFDGALKVRVSAPPVEGAANERLRRFLAREVLGLPVSRVVIASGERGRSKVLRVELSAEEVERRLQALTVG